MERADILGTAPSVREVDGGLVVDWPDPRTQAFAVTAEAFEALVDRANRGALVVRPGDTVILSTRGIATAEQAETMRTALLDNLPGVADVVVVAGADVAAYRPGS